MIVELLIYHSEFCLEAFFVMFDYIKKILMLESEEFFLTNDFFYFDLFSYSQRLGYIVFVQKAF